MPDDLPIIDCHTCGKLYLAEALLDLSDMLGFFEFDGEPVANVQAALKLISEAYELVSEAPSSPLIRDTSTALRPVYRIMWKAEQVAKRCIAAGDARTADAAANAGLHMAKSECMPRLRQLGTELMNDYPVQVEHEPPSSPSAEMSTPQSPKVWARVFGVSVSTIVRYFRRQTVPNEMQTTKSYRVRLAAIPEGQRDKFVPPDAPTKQEVARK